jgi:DNA-binding LacI/PurR family transcriptional regulator
VLEQTKLTLAEANRLLQGMRRVFIDPQFPQVEPMVSVDRNAGAGMIIEYLISLGHRRFGLLGISPTTTWRWPGIVAALRRHRFDPDKVVQVYETPVATQSPYEMGTLLAEIVLGRSSPPTALVAHNDRVAIGALHFLQKQGIKVPEQFSVTGFDNLKVSHFFHPTLTTVDQQAHLLMKCAGELLLNQMQKTSRISSRNLITPVLVRGGSTGPVSSTRKLA